MKALVVSALAALSLSACATYNLTDGERLALYEAHAGAPVQRINYVTPIGWTRVDDHHVALDMRPGERWLLTITGPCLGHNRSAASMSLSPSGAMIVSRFDQIHVAGSTMGCRIEEIRPIDLPAFRTAERALIDKR